jgi:predicted HTH transcriptional regulator
MEDVTLNVRADRRLDTEGLAALVAAVRDAHLREPETAAVEWKRSLDLDDSDVRFHLARHLLGFANRSVVVSARSFGGFAYLLVGVSAGELVGVQLADPARLDDALARYIAPGRPHWELKLLRVAEITIAVLEVQPPQPGDRIATLQRGYKNAEPGRIFVRRAGKTVEASPEEVRMLEERFAQPSHEAAARKPAAMRLICAGSPSRRSGPPTNACKGRRRERSDLCPAPGRPA